MATASLVDTLTASGGTESAGFLNDIIAQLWPRISVVGSKMLKDIVEPILASTLPGPLASLRFTKIEFGNIPFTVSRVDTHKTQDGNIKLDMDVLWEGQSDIELDGKMIPMIGIERVHLKGRLSVLLAPLMDVMPLIGAAQVSFINPPELEMDFTNAANIADSFLLKNTIRKTILGIIAGMAVLPNRYLVKLDGSNDWFKTYQPHLGVLRLTIGNAVGVTGPKKSGAKRLLAKIVKDVPDCYCTVNVGAEEEWRTSTRKNDHDPEWNETHDFLVTDFEQAIFLDVKDDDLGGDDDIGLGRTTVKDVLLAGGTHELALSHKGNTTDARVTVHAKFFHFVTEASALSAQHSQGEGQLCGLATVLIASALGLEGKRDDLQPSVKITWGGKEYRTAIRTYTPGTDIFNPSFDQAFKFPITGEMLANAGNFKLTLLNKEVESGVVEIPFTEVQSASGLVIANNYDVGGGAVIRASVTLHGLQEAQ
ncbi:hypothetical protein ACN47E_000860 [Coniothyrium glycines]